MDTHNFKTNQCNQCCSTYLDVNYIPNRVLGYCSYECQEIAEEEELRIKKWRERLDSYFKKEK